MCVCVRQINYILIVSYILQQWIWSRISPRKLCQRLTNSTAKTKQSLGCTSYENRTCCKLVNLVGSKQLCYWVSNYTLAARVSKTMCVCVCFSLCMYTLTCHRQTVCLCDDPRMCPTASGTHWPHPRHHEISLTPATQTHISVIRSKGLNCVVVFLVEMKGYAIARLEGGGSMRNVKLRGQRFQN